MNKRQRKNAQKRHYQRMEKSMYRFQQHMAHFWCTAKPQNEIEHQRFQYNLSIVNYHDAEARKERIEQQKMRARGRAWRHRKGERV